VEGVAGVGDASLESWMTIGLWESFISSFGKVALVVFRVPFLPRGLLLVRAVYGLCFLYDDLVFLESKAIEAVFVSG
jgi:hypothetical protein